jgi:NarL family two-component system response regulator LiaR
MNRRVGVLVVDDSPVFLEAVRDVLASAPEFELVGEALTGEEGVAMAMRVHPDLVLIDVLLPGIDGLEACRRLRSGHPAPVVVLCSVEDDPRPLLPETECGGTPFLDKCTINASTLRQVWREELSKAGQLA